MGRRMRVVRRALIVGVLVAICVWARCVEPRRLVVHEETIAIPGWPAAMHGLRVLAISDLHVGSPHMPRARLEEVVRRANSLSPDAVVLLGDFVAGHREAPDHTLDQMSAILAQLHAPLGVYAVLGNHDWWFDGARVRHVLERAKVRVLDGEAAPIARDGARAWLFGLPDRTTRHPRPDRMVAAAQLPAGEPIVALTHDPDLFPEVPVCIALTLAGHTHGGQVRLPIVGAPVVPSRYKQRYAGGRVDEDGHTLFVTTGVGTSILPIRFGVPPELALLTLE